MLNKVIRRVCCHCGFPKISLGFGVQHRKSKLEEVCTVRGNQEPKLMKP